MKKILLSFSTLCFFAVNTLSAQSIDRCGTMQYTAQEEAQNPNLVQIRQQIEQQMQNYILQNQNSTAPATVLTIPVVVHILYATAAQNIADSKVISQIEQLNLDYASLNADSGNTPAIFKPLRANTSVQFCLATQDPNGNPTNGIIHKSTTVGSWSTNDAIKHNSSLGDDAWLTTKYLNLWIGNLGGGLLGYAQFPGGSATNDGVVVHYGSVGSALNPSTYNWGGGTNYNWGRTSTHEIGHWLNLRHINGDATCGNDLVSDTPTQDQLHFGCATHPYHVNVCSGTTNGEMFMDYMDYVDDDCMNMFSLGQSTRMNAAINTYRSGLATSLGCTPVGVFYPEAGLNASIYPNPANSELNVNLNRDKKTDIHVALVNPLGEEVYTNDILNTSEVKLVVDLTKFANGAYLLTLKTTEGTLTKKITIQH